MRAIGISLILYSLSFSLGSLAKPGGWGSSGGGSGVACFTNEETAKKADAFIDNSLEIPQELQNEIETLQTLDYWEWAQKKSFTLMTDQDMTSDQIIASMQSRMQYVAPLFTYRMKQTTNLIDVGMWVPKKSLPRIYDATPSRPLPIQCRLVQLVARFSGDNRERQDGPSLRVPTLKTEYNIDLFKRLNPMNQAILRMHEQAYLLGQATGQHSSDVLRNLVMRFFADNFINPKERRKLRVDLVKVFSDHTLFFGEDFKAVGEIGTQESRFNSFYKVINLIWARQKECRESKNISPNSEMTDEVLATIKTCQAQAMNIFDLQNYLDEEMSFVFLTYFIFDVTENIFEAEILIAPHQNDRYKSYTRMALTDACGAMNATFDRYDSRLEPLLTKAGDYCANPFPTGTDQN